ncbi:MAG: ATP-binding protein [Gammaproteobacteria bacterium]|nr:ATP-binding protein [Gammaproteobacteria bacterium]
MGDNTQLTSSEETRPFHLLHWFAGLSLLVVALASVGSAIGVSRFMTKNLLERDVRVTMEFVSSVVEDANARHVADRPELPPDAHPQSAIEHYMSGDIGKLPGQSHEANAGLDEFFERVAKMPDVLRVNIYKPDGSVVWSSINEYIGENFGDNDELDSALAGLPVADIQVSGDVDKTEHMVFPEPGIRYIENYVPIWTDNGKSVAGVLEVYKSPTTLFNAVDNSRRVIWIAAVVVGIFLYIMLFFIVQRGNRIIQLHQKRLLESETLLALGEMSAAIAHAIRNPLASVRSASEVALDEGTVESARESLQDIVKETDRLDKWVRDLLVYSNPSQEDIEQVQAHEIISDCLNGYRDTIRKQNVQLEYETPPVESSVLASAAALTQVFNVLIENALQVMTDGGELAVTERTINAGKKVEITVSDTGPGISPENMEKIFKPFYTSKSAGLGVGLGIAKRIVERFSGELEISSSGGQGTSATVRLPLAT